MTGNCSSDESGSSDGERSDDDDDDDDDSAASSASLWQHVKSTTKAIPGDAFDPFKFWMPKIWEYYKLHLLNDVVCVLYLLSSEPTIMAFASNHDNRDPEDRLACEHLIMKMFVSNHFLCKEEQEQEEARLIDKFWQERNDFWTKQRYFKSRHIWITADNPNCIAHEWHKNYSSPFTEVLGKLGCSVGNRGSRAPLEDHQA
jgi:hypothetical protein